MLQIKENTPMSVFSSPYFDNHEQVVFFADDDVGLKGIIAVHSTVMGPAVGGCRMWNYATEEDALQDVLRLSRGMSYKNALANLGLGGGKSVIFGDSRTDKSPELFQAFGRMIDRLNGSYITAEDVGIDVDDMHAAATQTEYVAGLEKGDHAAGDPSPFTAHGVFSGLRAAVKHRLGKESVDGLTVIVQGVGHVGYNLCRELHEAGANLIITDIHQEHIDRAVNNFGAKAVAPDDIFKQVGDVFAPCAMGAVLNDQTIPQLQVPVIAGAANNQLDCDRHGEELHQLGILYTPDYVINAGGIIQVANEVHERNVTEEDGMKKVEEIYDTLLEVFQLADKENKPTNLIADKVAQKRIAVAKGA